MKAKNGARTEHLEVQRQERMKLYSAAPYGRMAFQWTSCSIPPKLNDSENLSEV